MCVVTICILLQLKLSNNVANNEDFYACERISLILKENVWTFLNFVLFYIVKEETKLNYCIMDFEITYKG